MLRLGKIKIPMAINKALLEHNHTPSFLYCLWLFCATVTELGSWKRNRITCKGWNIYYLAYYRKALLTLVYIIVLHKKKFKNCF